MNPWAQLASLPTAGASPASLRPAPRLAGVGPLAGGSGVPRLAGGIREDALAPPPAAPPAAGVPIPPARPPPGRTELSRRPRLIDGIADAATDFGAGIANDYSTAPPITAFGQGLSGALASGAARSEADRTAALDAENLKYERSRDTIEDDRADRRLAIEEETFAEQKASDYWDKSKTSGKNYVDKTGALTPEGVSEVYGFVNDEVDSLRDFYQQSGLIRRSNAGEIEGKIAAYAKQYREDLEAAMKAGKSPFEVPRPVDKAAKELTTAPRLVPDDEYSDDTSGLGNITAKGDALGDTRRVVPPAPGGEAVKPASLTGDGTKERPYTSDDAVVAPGEWYEDATGKAVQYNP